MLQISPRVALSEEEVELHAIRAQGAGGQNVNKVATAIHLRFDIVASSLPQEWKQRLLALNDSRISRDGVLIIKAQRFRTQEKNREDALARLQALVQSVSKVQKKRVPTRLSKGKRMKQLDRKAKHGKLKQMRRKVGTSGE